MIHKIIFNKSLILFFLIVLLLVSRLSFWQAAAESNEFLFRGTLAKDIIDGLEANIFTYSYTPYLGSTTLVGLLAVPFFLLCGDSFFSLYMVGLLLPLLMLITLYHFTVKYFNTNAALIACYIFVTAPFGYTICSTYAIGIHPDVALFTLILFSLFMSMLFLPHNRNVYYGHEQNSKVERKLMWKCIVGGLISGIACYVCFTFIASLFILMFFWILFDMALFKRKYIYIFICSFFIGLIPWMLAHFYFNDGGYFLPAHDAAKSISLGNMFFVKGRQSFATLTFLLYRLGRIFSLEKFNSLLPIFVPRKLFFNIIGLSIGSGFISCITVVGLWCFSKYKRDTTYINKARNLQKEVLVFSYVLLIVVLWVLHPMIWPSNVYLTPAYPFVAILIGVLIDKIIRIKIGFITLRTTAVLLLAMVLFSGYFYYADSLEGFEIGNIRESFTIKGYSLEGADMTLEKNHRNNFLRTDLYVSTRFFGKNPQADVYYTINRSGEKRYSLVKNYALLEQIRPEVRAYACVALGLIFGNGLHEDILSTFVQQLNDILERRYHHFFYEGIAVSYCNRMYTEVLNGFQSGIIEQYIPPRFLHYFFIEFGRRVMRKYKHNITDGLLFLDQFSSEFRGYLYHGFVGSLTDGQVRIVQQFGERKKFGFLQKYLYFRQGELFGNILVQRSHDNDIVDDSLEQIRPHHRVYYIWGISNAVYNHTFDSMQGIDEKPYNKVPFDILKSSLKKIFNYAISPHYIPFLHQGLGLSVSLNTFGELSYFNAGDIEEIIPEDYRSFFYEGYGIGLAMRYGTDKEKITELCAMHIPVSYTDSVINGWREGINYCTIDN